MLNPELIRRDPERTRATLQRRDEDAERDELRQLGDRLSSLEQSLQQATTERDQALAWVPNLPDATVPPGKDDTQNEILRTWGEPRQFDFEPLPHWELADRLGILDLEAGASLAGARFFVLKGA